MKKFRDYLFVGLIFNITCGLQSGTCFSKEIEEQTIPHREVRAVWIATVFSLDWPKSLDLVEQQRSLREIVTNLKRANFNTIFFQVRGRADAMYRSSYEPWSSQLTGEFGKNPGWDPLEFIIREAHAQALEVHAWFNTFLIKTASTKSISLDSLHLVTKYPHWVKNHNGMWWLDPGLPEVQEYLLKVALEIVRNYHIDGFHFDYIRYPGRNFPDDDTYLRYGGGIPRSDWRRNNINNFVRRFYDSVIVIKPMLKIGSSPIGVYDHSIARKAQSAYSDLFQESRQWMREKKHDYLAPQIYWTFSPGTNYPDFANLAKDWLANSYGRQIILGIGAYKPEVMKRLPEKIDTARLLGSNGLAFFRYSYIKESLELGNKFRYPALLPPMLWKDSVVPNSPINLKAVLKRDNQILLKWQCPQKALDGDTARFFVIYKSINNSDNIVHPRNLLKILRGNVLEFTDTSIPAQNRAIQYAVTALDKGNNESTPAWLYINKSFCSTKRNKQPYGFELISYTIANKYDYISVQYEIPKASQVFINILDEKASIVFTFNDSLDAPGCYINSINTAHLAENKYILKFKSGEYEASQIIFIKR